MTTAVTVVSDRPERVERALGGRWARIGLIASITVFLGVTVWWLVADSRVMDWDSGRHMFNTWAMRDALASGDLLAVIELDNINHYPPLLYLVGSLGMAIGGRESLDAAMLAMNVVFVPLLALGCWGTARLAYGELAGVLAAVFALGTPMVVSAFHLYMLDVPQAAMVAVTVWLVLASRRFERTGISALAGVAGGGAMLLKPTSAIFLAGPVLVVLIRGGWRRPLGFVALLAAGAVVSAPWYVEQFDNLRTLYLGATAVGPSGAAAVGPGYLTPPRWSEENWLWYAWNLLNVQLLGPLFACFVAGTVVAVARFVRSRAPDDLTPELVIGGLVSYVGVTWISLKDSRYSLAAMVFVAALAVAWIPALRRPWFRLAAAGAVTAFALVNLIGVSAGVGGSVALDLDPGHQGGGLGERTVRFYSSGGYIASAPRDDGDVLAVMKAFREDGYERMVFEPNGEITFSSTGLAAFQAMSGLRLPANADLSQLPPRTLFLTRRAIPPDGPEPCGRMSDHWGIYVALQRNVVVPFESYNLVCPRSPLRR